MPTYKCPKCGYRNDVSARFCGNCRLKLNPVPAQAAKAGGLVSGGSQATGTASAKAGVGQLVPRTPPAQPQVPPAGPLSLTRYNLTLKPPAELEGTVLDVNVAHQRTVSPAKVVFAIALSLLKFFPWFRPDDTLELRYLRIQKQPGVERDATMLGTPSANISVGDDVALWGTWRGNVLLVSRAYNLRTGSHVQLRR